MYVYEVFNPKNKIGCFTETWEIKGFKDACITEEYIDIFRSLNLHTEEFEQHYTLALDANNKPIGVLHDSEGIRTKVYVEIGTIIAFLTLIGANKFITIHNHPTEILEDSNEDKMLSNLLGLSSMYSNSEFLGEYILTRKGYKKVGEDCIFEFKMEDLL